MVLNGSDVATANGVLKVASTTEQVVVTAEAPIIDSADQTISNTITSTAVIDLPRDSRDVYQFLYLNPNITQGVDAGEFKFLGFQSYGANFTSTASDQLIRSSAPRRTQRAFARSGQRSQCSFQ